METPSFQHRPVLEKEWMDGESTVVVWFTPFSTGTMLLNLYCHNSMETLGYFCKGYISTVSSCWVLYECFTNKPKLGCAVSWWWPAMIMLTELSFTKLTNTGLLMPCSGHVCFSSVCDIDGSWCTNPTKVLCLILTGWDKLSKYPALRATGQLVQLRCKISSSALG